MAESNRPSSLPKFAALQDLVDFFDTQDLGDYIAGMPEAQFEVGLHKRRYLVTIDAELMKQLSEIARARKVSPASLIDAWLREKASQAAA